MTRQRSDRPLALLCVAASEDIALLTRWEMHLLPLQQTHLISFWSEQHLSAGADRNLARTANLEHSDLILLLLSADFFASPVCCDMMERALWRAYEGKTRVIPILLRPVAWQETQLASIARWPANGMPISQWTDQDAGWDACMHELRRLLGRRVSETVSSQHPAKHVDLDWERMLRRLRRFYAELLDQSLRSIPWIELGLSTRSDRVSNATNLLFRLPNDSERFLMPGTSILDAFDEAEGELLILGTPGSGKSTLLLDLGQQLVSRALANEISLLPVILPLSSWAIRRSALADWMVEQLNCIYDVPQHLSERWVTQGRLLPLLDNLDEVEELALPACIAAINSYHRTHLTPILICSRQAEYEVAAQRGRLALQSAVIIQPLRDKQIENYLAAGSSFAGVRAALHQRGELRELATTPLMLSVLLQTYKGISTNDITKQTADLERQVWADYVDRMVQEKGNMTRYPIEYVHPWLRWLALQMRAHQQAAFYVEHLDIDWLPSTQQRMVSRLTTLIPSIVIGICASLLASIFLGSSSDPTFLLQMGVLGGFIGGCLCSSFYKGVTPLARHPQARIVPHVRNAVLIGILVASSSSLHLLYYSGYPYGMSDWLRDGCVLGLGTLLSGWAFQVLAASPPKQQFSVSSWTLGPRRLLLWATTTVSPHTWQLAATLAIGIGLSNGIITVLGLMTVADLNTPTSLLLSLGLDYGLIVGLCVGVTVILVRLILDASLATPRFAERIHWTWRTLFHREHLRATFKMAAILSLLYVLSFWLTFSIAGMSKALSEALGLGLKIGLSVGCTYWMLLGLYQGMKQEHLEDQNRQRFNQGIRISLRNGLLICLVSAIVSITIYGLINGLDSALNGDHRLDYQGGLIVLIAGIVIMWSLSGGPTVLRHYVLRWFLARCHTFPFNASSFLYDATNRNLLRRVGSGYSFIHRRLQDYFADAAAPPSQD